MVNSRKVLMCTGLVAVLIAGVCGDADARHRKHPTAEAAPATDYDGTPIIMKGYRPKRVRVLPSVSSPVLVPPPYASPRDLPPRQLLQAPAPTATVRPAAPSFSDRVTSCIHSFPLNAGVGNNPTDRDSYVRQCAN